MWWMTELVKGRLPAPEELRIVEAFVNTWDVEERTDVFDATSSAKSWLLEHGLIGPKDTVDDAEASATVEVREALRALLVANNGGPRDESAVNVLNRTSEQAKIGLRVDADGAAILAPGASGVAGALGRLLVISFEAMRQETWWRLKACRNEACRWIFYDTSKNRSGAWCSMATCGNRAKTLTYYRRHRRG